MKRTTLLDAAGETARCEPLGPRWSVLRTIGAPPFQVTLLVALDGSERGELTWQATSTLYPCAPAPRAVVAGDSRRVLAGQLQLPRDPLMFVEQHAQPDLGLVARSTLRALRSAS